MPIFDPEIPVRRSQRKTKSYSIENGHPSDVHRQMLGTATQNPRKKAMPFLIVMAKVMKNVQIKHSTKIVS
jgi:hypothetical protein